MAEPVSADETATTMVVDNDKESIRRFRFDGDLWATVDGWAAETGFRLKEPGNDHRLYQHEVLSGASIMGTSTILDVTKRGPNVELRAWLKTSGLQRLQLMFLVGEKTGARSGGIKLVFDRKIARGKLNALFERLRKPLIP